jgi:hypothetical protein
VLVRRIACVAALFCAVSAGAAPAHAQERRVPPGVSAGGVDLSNLTLAEAEAKIATTLGPLVAKPLVFGVAGRPFTLKTQQAKLKLDALLTAKRALYATAPPPPPEAGGAVVGTVVPVALSHSRPAVRAFVAGVAGRIHRPGRNATIKIVRRLAMSCFP